MSAHPRALAAPPGATRAARLLGDVRARPNVRWLVRLVGGRESEIQVALKEIAAREDIHREVFLRHVEGGRRSYAQFRAPFELYTLVRLLRPDHVVETGVSSGVSSAYILLALQRNRRGRLHSIDRPMSQRRPKLGARESPVAIPPGRASGWAVPDRLRRPWDLRLGPSERLLPDLLARIPSVGLFLHDSRHTPAHLRFELETVRAKLTPGAVVLADNTVWTGDAFPRFARSLGSRMCRRGHSDLVGLSVP